MTDANISIATRMLDQAVAKDLEGAMALFTEDAVFFDPHYPKTRMQGHAEIIEGLRWGFNSLKKFGFNIINTYPSADGKGLVIFVRTAHELPNGKPLNFPQLFVFEFEGELVKSLEAYVQYEPHGVVGLMLKVIRIIHVLKHWKNQLTGRTAK